MQLFKEVECTLIILIIPGLLHFQGSEPFFSLGRRNVGEKGRFEPIWGAKRSLTGAKKCFEPISGVVKFKNFKFI